MLLKHMKTGPHVLRSAKKKLDAKVHPEYVEYWGVWIANSPIEILFAETFIAFLRLHKNVFISSGMGVTSLNSKGPTNVRSLTRCDQRQLVDSHVSLQNSFWL